MSGAHVKADLWVNEYISPWDIYQHGVQELLVARRTQYQQMQIVTTGMYGKALVLDGKWQSCSGDEFLYHEPLVQPAMILHGNVKRALVLGGGEGATIREILRWKTVEKVVMVDIDGEVVEACKEHMPELHQGAFEDPRAEVIIGDALEYLDKTDERFDLVISDLSDPIEEGPSFKLFTKEYFEQIKRVLNPDGFFVVQAGPVAPGEMALHVRLVNTVNAVWPNARSYSSHVPTYASPWGFGIASNRPIDTRPDVNAVNALLESKTTGGLRFIDGETLLGLMQTPAHIRRALEAETEVYTLTKPPKFFGKGVSVSGTD